MKTITPTIQPTPKQNLAWKKLLDKKTKYIVFGGGAGGGKSWLGAEWLMTNCYKYPRSRWFIGREELKRLMSSSFITFKKVCRFHNIPDEHWKINGQYNFIEFFNGSRIDLLDLAHKPTDAEYERLGSLEYTGGWIEEAGETNFGAFDVLKTRIGRHLNKKYDLSPKLYLSCNPNKGWLYREVYKPFKSGQLDDKYSYIQSLFGDNPHTAELYKEQLSDITDKSKKQRLMFGNWEYDDADNCLVKYDDIIDMFTNPVLESNEKYLVADIARYGGDKIVRGFWKGLHCYNIKWKEKQGLDTTIDEIRTDLKNEAIPRSKCIVDEDGVGGGVKDALSGIKGFVNNSSPLDVGGEKQNFQNLKTQCAYELARNIRLHKIKITVESEQVKQWIIEEVELLKSKDADKDGKLKIIPKEEMKELLGRSPDFLDMLIMRQWYELKPRITSNQFTATKKQFV